MWRFVHILLSLSLSPLKRSMLKTPYSFHTSIKKIFLCEVHSLGNLGLEHELNWRIHNLVSAYEKLRPVCEYSDIVIGGTVFFQGI